jgi:ribosome-binding factor A
MLSNGGKSREVEEIMNKCLSIMEELQLAIHDSDVHPLTVVAISMSADIYAMLGLYKLDQKDASIEMAKE